jgi:IS5 family transposase
MAKKRSGGPQPELFARSKRPTIPIEPSHRLVLLTDEIDWPDLETKVEELRMSKLKSAAGRPPRLRALVGALLLKATRDMTWREAEDLIRHYAPARYLCGLTETEWSPDHTTLHDFAVLLGEDGVKLINEYAVKWAVREKLADPSVVVGDTTAQEAAIPYPNEMGLMAAFVTSVVGAAQRGGRSLKAFLAGAAERIQGAKRKAREYRLFAHTKPLKDRMLMEMTRLIEGIQKQLGAALKSPPPGSTSARVARAKLEKLHGVMHQLVPQIRYWIRTGWVAKDKIINLAIPELYSIVRGKVGKTVEFGLRWGFSRLRGGFLLARVAADRRELFDHRYALAAVRDHISLFGKAPRAYGYDRGGFSATNVKSITRMGVRHVALAPQGRATWAVSERMRRRMSRERAMIEGGIGAVKSSRYNFHRPRARSVRMMGAAGQLATLGFNLNKLARAFAERRGLAIAG